MIIAISGTPGTGKTAVANVLAKELGANLISLTSLLKKGKIHSAADKSRKTRVVSAADVKSAAKKYAKKGEINIVDGHMSHFADADIVVVLRCRPDILKKRMAKRGWPEKKIRENIQAEILDAITIEAVEAHGRKGLVEIDTTRCTPEKTAGIIKKVLNNHALQRKYVPGKVNWSARFSKLLIEQEKVSK
jgi:adenylate kinase